MFKTLALALCFFNFLGADTIKVSSNLNTLNNFTYETQHSQKVTIPYTTKTLLISFEKDTGKLVNEYLASKYPQYLEKFSIVFIVDINEMPSIITKLFALPKMREYKHPIYLHYTEEFSKYVPSKEEKVTVIKIEDKKVSSISFISNVKELKEAIEN